MDHIAGATMEFSSPEQIMQFNVKIKPSDGMYGGATFQFHVEVPTTYP
jgi:ubiquitin-protein ligase